MDTDPSGGAAPNAHVKILNLDTNLETNVGSGHQGYYVAGPLTPGRYRIEVQAPGFKTWTRDLTLDVNQRAQVDVELSVGQLSESVKLSGDAPLLDTQTSRLATFGAR
jgi:hypothetical protein